MSICMQSIVPVRICMLPVTTIWPLSAYPFILDVLVCVHYCISTFNLTSSLFLIISLGHNLLLRISLCGPMQRCTITPLPLNRFACMHAFMQIEDTCLEVNISITLRAFQRQLVVSSTTSSRQQALYTNQNNVLSFNERTNNCCPSLFWRLCPAVDPSGPARQEIILHHALGPEGLAPSFEHHLTLNESAFFFISR